MNLVDFIKYYNDSGCLSYIINGFEKSQWVDLNTGIFRLVRAIIDTNTGGYNKVYKQLQSGITVELREPTVKKISYCTEFDQMLANLLGMLGWEFSSFIMMLLGIRHITAREIEAILKCNTYKDIARQIKFIHNLYTYPVVVDEQFYTYLNNRKADTTTHSLMFVGGGVSAASTINTYNNNTTSSEINYFSAVQYSTLDKVFDDILKQISNYETANNEIAFEINREEWYSIMYMLLKYTTFDEYNVDNIDQLIMNNRKMWKDTPFVKLFQLSMMETVSDAPYEMQSYYKPWLTYCQKLNIRIDTYQTALQSYFTKVYEDTCAVCTGEHNVDGIKLNITSSLITQLSDIAFNLCVGIGKFLSELQNINALFGHSIRIQFMHVYQAALYMLPRYCVIPDRQKCMLHYLLLSNKVLIDVTKLIVEGKTAGTYDDAESVSSVTTITDGEPKRNNKAGDVVDGIIDEGAAGAISNTVKPKRGARSRGGRRKQSEKTTATNNPTTSLYQQFQQINNEQVHTESIKENDIIIPPSTPTYDNIFNKFDEYAFTTSLT